MDADDQIEFEGRSQQQTRKCGEQQVCRTGGICCQLDLLGRDWHKLCRAFGAGNLQHVSSTRCNAAMLLSKYQHRQLVLDNVSSTTVWICWTAQLATYGSLVHNGVSTPPKRRATRPCMHPEAAINLRSAAEHAVSYVGEDQADAHHFKVSVSPCIMVSGGYVTPFCIVGRDKHVGALQAKLTDVAWSCVHAVRLVVATTLRAPNATKLLINARYIYCLKAHQRQHSQ